MLLTCNRKTLFTLYLTVLRPSLVFANTSSMTTGAEDKESPEKYSVAYVTVPSKDVGKELAHKLVTNKLAACVNIVPQVTSVYEWQNMVHEDEEALLMIKTRTSLVTKLSDFVRANHPYAVCEVISLPIQNGNPPYLKWIGDTVPEQ